MGNIATKICTFWHFNGFFCFAVSRKNHVTRGPTGICCVFSEKQACIARRHPSEMC